MEKREALGHYAACDGPSARPDAFRDPEDRLAFIQAHAGYLEADVRRGYRDHGRGIVLLQATPWPLVRSSYATCRPEDFDASRPEAR